MAERIFLPLGMDSSLIGYAGSWAELPKAAVPYILGVTPDFFRDTCHQSLVIPSMQSVERSAKQG